MMRLIAPSVLIAALCLWVETAGAQPVPKTPFAYASIGIATQSLDDLNDDISDDEREFRAAGVPASFDEFGTGFPISIGGGYMITDAVSAGGSLFYQKGSTHNERTDATTSLTANADVSVWGLLAEGAYWFAAPPGLTFVGELGVGFGKASSETSFRDFFAAGTDFDASGEWSGVGPILGMGVGYSEQWGDGGPFFFGRLGYRYQNLGTFDGDYTHSQLGSRSGPPRNNAGQPMDTDFSGFHFLAGVGFLFPTR